MPVATISDFQDGAAARSFRDRTCPNLVTWWAFSWDAYSLSGSPDRASYVRRICMWIVLISRVLLGLFAFKRYAEGLRIEMIIISPILTMLEFFFIGFCLAHIGQSEGQRRVLGIMVGRYHFDLFLGLCAGNHAGLVVGSFFSWGASVRDTMSLIWWILIVAAAWVASWPAETQEDSEGRVSLV